MGMAEQLGDFTRPQGELYSSMFVFSNYLFLQLQSLLGFCTCVDYQYGDTDFPRELGGYSI